MRRRIQDPGSPGLFMPPKANPVDIIAFIDGGARGNPGPAGYGVYIRDSKGGVVAELSKFLGVQTNNVAEYSGLVAALEFAIQNGYKNVQVVSDSELLVKQMRGQYKVNSPDLKPLHERARTMSRKLESFDIRHVLRAQNKDADRLANRAMDEGMGKPASSMSAGRQTPAPSDNGQLLNGIVKGGVVHFLGEDLPEGTLVTVSKKE
jgi:ribonuclease HI